MMLRSDFIKKDLLNMMDLGWHLFPLTLGSKLPLQGIPWAELSTTDEEQIQCICDVSSFNFAVHCGPSNLCIIDVDGAEGKRSLQLLEQRYGPLPPTITSCTPRGGWHFYFSDFIGSVQSASKIGYGIDIRAGNGYALVPPSHINGVEYKWISGPLEQCVSTLPIEWMDAIRSQTKSVERKKTKQSVSIETLNQRVGVGARNQTLFSYACSCHARGLSKFVKLLSDRYNKVFCSPPLPDREVQMILKSASKYKQENIPDWYLRRLTNEQYRLR